MTAVGASNPGNPEVVDRVLYDVLKHVWHLDWQLLGDHLTCITAPAEELPPGSARILPEGVTSCPPAIWTDVVSEVNRITGMPIDAQMPDDYGGEADFCIQCTTAIEDVISHRYAAPWFMTWLAESSLAPVEVRDKAQAVARAEMGGLGAVVYRGESETFPMVRSGLSRQHDTKSPGALRELTREQVRRLKSGRGSRVLLNQMSDLDVAVAYQHLGGKTNLIDFSWSPWVALYFACRGAPAKVGQLFCLDTSKCGASVTAHSIFESGYPLAQERLMNQLGVLVEPESGFLPSPLIRTLITIEPHEKPMFLELLERVHIKYEFLFDDLVARAQEYDGSKVSDLAWMYLMTERLAGGDFAGVWEEANRRATAEGFARDSGLCYRGLANAFLGRLEEARADIDALIAHHKGPPIKAAEKNLRVIERAIEIGRADYVRGKLDTAVEPQVVTVEISGYDYLEGSHITGGVRANRSPINMTFGPG